MKQTISITYPANPTRTAAMLADPAYQQQRAARVGLQDAKVEVKAEGQGFAATISGHVDPSRLPATAAKFVRSGVTFSVTESWSQPAADGTRTGAYNIEIKGAPVRAQANATMAPTGENTVVTLELDLKVSVPLVGKTIEEKAMGRLGIAVADEEKRGAAWLAEH